jgi:hypothetical protein
VIGWWSAVVLAIVATVLLNSWLADETRIGAQRAASGWPVFAALAAITGWSAASVRYSRTMDASAPAPASARHTDRQPG